MAAISASPRGPAGVIAFSRVLSNREILVVANTNGSAQFGGAVLCDIDINRNGKTFTVTYSNKGTAGSGTTKIAQGTVYSNGVAGAPGAICSLGVVLAPWEVQILLPS